MDEDSPVMPPSSLPQKRYFCDAATVVMALRDIVCSRVRMGPEPATEATTRVPILEPIATHCSPEDDVKAAAPRM